MSDLNLRDQIARAYADWAGLSADPLWQTEDPYELADALLPLVRTAAKQRAAKILREAADWIWDEAPALASASAELHARADHLEDLAAPVWEPLP